MFMQLLSLFSCLLRTEKRPVCAEIKSIIFGVEGVVIDIEGPGDVLVQTKNIREFVDWLKSLIDPMVRRDASSAAG